MTTITLEVTDAQAALIRAVLAVLDEAAPLPAPPPAITPAATWLAKFGPAFNGGDKLASGGEDYRDWPKRRDGKRIYFAGYPIEALAKMWKLGGDAGHLDEACILAAQGFQTIAGLTEHVSLDEMLYCRGISYLVDVMPEADARRAQIIEARRAVWDYHWAHNGVKRDIGCILSDDLLTAYSMAHTDPERADQAIELIAWAEARLKATYDAAEDGVWLQSVSADPRYPGPNDTGHVCREAAMIARALRRGDGTWAAYLPLMVSTFRRVYNTDTRRFANALDGTGTPRAHNFGFLWAALGAVDLGVQQAFESYCEPWNGRQSDAYLALWYAQMAENAAAHGVMG